jgi:hypothetical protein
MTPQEKLVKRLEENNLALKANVSIDHANQDYAKALMMFATGMWIKLTPIVEVIEKPKEEPKEVLPE